MLNETTERQHEGAEKKAPEINVVVTVDGEEQMNVALDTLFLVGIRKDGMTKDGAQMTVCVSGNYGPVHSRHIKKVALEQLSEYCRDPLGDLLAGLKGEHGMK